MTRIGWMAAVAVVAAAAPGACATGEGPLDRSGPACLNAYDIRSFSPLRNEYLYVQGPGDRHYLFTMERGCIGLRSAEIVGFPDRLGRICSNTFDQVLYREAGGGRASCRILDIELVGSREEARELAEVRTKARRDDASPRAAGNLR